MSWGMGIVSLMIVFGIIYLVINHQGNKNLPVNSSNEIKDEEFEILDSIVKKARLKNTGKSIDMVCEKLIRNNTELKFTFKSERYYEK